MGSSFLEIEVFRMTLILQDPSTKKPYEINSAQVETPVQKNMKTNEVRLIYLFILVLILVIIAAIVFSTATMPPGPTTTTSTTTEKATTTVTLNTTAISANMTES